MPSGRGMESQGSDVHAHSYNIVHALADGQAGWGTTPVVAAVGREQEEGGADGCTRANKEQEQFYGRVRRSLLSLCQYRPKKMTRHMPEFTVVAPQQSNERRLGEASASATHWVCPASCALAPAW